VAEAPKPIAVPVAAAPAPATRLRRLRQPNRTRAEAVAAAKPAETKARPPSRPGCNVAEIAKAIDLWAAAWSRKDVKAYLGAYARDFKTPAGESRAAVGCRTEKRINKPGAIQVSVREPARQRRWRHGNGEVPPALQVGNAQDIQQQGPATGQA
jgi:hypothetical protein